MFILFSRWGVSASAKIVELGSRARLDFIATVPRSPWSGSAGGVTKRNPGSICSGSMCKESIHGMCWCQVHGHSLSLGGCPHWAGHDGPIPYTGRTRSLRTGGGGTSAGPLSPNAGVSPAGPYFACPAPSCEWEELVTSEWLAWWQSWNRAGGAELHHVGGVQAATVLRGWVHRETVPEEEEISDKKRLHRHGTSGWCWQTGSKEKEAESITARLYFPTHLGRHVVASHERDIWGSWSQGLQEVAGASSPVLPWSPVRV